MVFSSFSGELCKAEVDSAGRFCCSWQGWRLNGKVLWEAFPLQFCLLRASFNWMYFATVDLFLLAMFSRLYTGNPESQSAHEHLSVLQFPCSLKGDRHGSCCYGR